MNRLIAIITGLHVLTHSVFGCCTHDILHVKSQYNCCHSTCENVCIDQPQPDERFEEPDSHALGCALCRSNSPAVPHHDCQHSSCQWLVSKSLSPADLLQLDLNNISAVTPCTLGVPAWKSDYAALRAQSEIAKPASQLRLHLTLSVLQI